MGGFVKFASGIDFTGRDALVAQREAGVKKLLAGFTVADPAVVLLGRETIFRNGKRVGWLSSGGYGHTLGVPIGYGYVRHPDGVTAEYVMAGQYELEVASTRVPAQAHLTPLYDPKMERVKV